MTTVSSNVRKPNLVKLKIPSRDELAKKPISDYTEVDKMMSSMPYDYKNEEIMNGKAFAKNLIRKINTCDPLDDELRFDMFTELFGTYSRSTIETPFTCEFGSNIHLGERVFINYNCLILDSHEVRIGDFSLFGPGVQIYTANHSLDPERRREIITKPVVIGKKVWIGGNVTILCGVTIGDGVTVAAGSVVTKDIESYSVAAGVPARVIKKIDPTKTE